MSSSNNSNTINTHHQLSYSNFLGFGKIDLPKDIKREKESSATLDANGHDTLNCQSRNSQVGFNTESDASQEFVRKHERRERRDISPPLNIINWPPIQTVEWLDDQQLSQISSSDLEKLMDRYFMAVVQQLVQVASLDDDLIAELDSLDSCGFSLFHYCCLYNLNALVPILMTKGVYIYERVFIFISRGFGCYFFTDAFK